MIFEDPPPPPPQNDARGVFFAVVTATLTTVATGLVTWGIDELRERYGSARRPPHEPFDTGAP